MLPYRVRDLGGSARAIIKAKGRSHSPDNPWPDAMEMAL